MKKQLILLAVSLFLVSSCNKKEISSEISSEPITSNSDIIESISSEILKDESLVFIQNEKTHDLVKFEKIINDEISDNNLKDKITKVVKANIESINNATSISEITNLEIKCHKEVYDLIPSAGGVYDFSSIDYDEMLRILSLLDQYIFRNNLDGIPYLPYYRLNLNSLDKKQWEEFFGKNGSISPNKNESDYWDVKPFLSNDNFIKGMKLAINKDEFIKLQKFEMHDKIREINGKMYIDIPYNESDYYEYDLERSREYFKVALKELIEDGVYDVSSLDKPIELHINFYLQGTMSFIDLVKRQLEEAFNDDSVTDGKFKLVIDANANFDWGDLFYNHYLNGKFDLGNGSMSSSSYNKYVFYDALTLHSDFNLVWGIDPSSIQEDCIVYKGEKFSYEYLVRCLYGKNILDNGVLFVPFEDNSKAYEFYKKELIDEIGNFKDFMLENVTEEKKIEALNSFYKNTISLFDKCKKTSDLADYDFYYDYFYYTQYGLLNTPNEFVDNSKLEQVEKDKIAKVLNKYLLDNHLIGIPLSNNYSLTFNTIDYQDNWDYLYGTNGLLYQNKESEYWTVNQLLTNREFIKGMNLCLNKDLFSQYVKDKKNNGDIIDYSTYSFYNYDLNRAQMYFKAAIEDLAFQEVINLYNVVDPIDLNIELAYDPNLSLTYQDEILNEFKNQVEKAFNDNKVTEGKVKLNINLTPIDSKIESLDDKIFKGRFDIVLNDSIESEKNNLFENYRKYSTNPFINNLVPSNVDIVSSSISACAYNNYGYSFDELLATLINLDDYNVFYDEYGRFVIEEKNK